MRYLFIVLTIAGAALLMSAYLIQPSFKLWQLQPGESPFLDGVTR